MYNAWGAAFGRPPLNWTKQKNKQYGERQRDTGK